MLSSIDTLKYAERETQLGLDLIRDGLAQHNPLQIHDGIHHLQMAAQHDRRAKQCLCRLKAKINPSAAHTLSLQDPCKMHFSAWEIDRLCELIDN